MENQDLFDLLLDIGFNDLIAGFEDKQVTKENLPTLPLTTVKEIVPESRLQIFLEKQQQLLGLIRIETSEANKHLNLKTPNVNRNSNVLSALDINVQPNRLFVAENVNIKKILNNSFEGKQILSWYQSKNRLDQRRRKKLVHFVIASVLNDCERDLNFDDFKILREKIITEFPSECGTVYFSPHVSKKESPTGRTIKAKGKLLNKYFNLKKLPLEIRTAKTVNEEQPEVEKSFIEASEDVKTSIEWLNTHEEPWETTKEHWEKTADYRYSQIGKEYNIFDIRISSIYEQWPILKTPKGYELINIDFELRKFSSIENAILDFHNFYLEATDVRPLRKDDHSDMLKTLLESEDLNENEKTLVKLLLLCYMLPSTARIPQGKKKFWKPTSSESFDGILAHVKIYGDIEKLKADRRLFAAAKKITVQPYVIVVGEADFKVSSIYLCIDEVIYEIPTLLQAIDICFKSFHTFNAKYSTQSEQIWLMLQLGLYKFRTKWDNKIIGVDEILNDMGRDVTALT